MKLEKYDSYKDSEINWLGEIPSEWEVKRVKEISKYIDHGWSPNAENRNVVDSEWGVLKLSAIKQGKYLEIEHKALSEITLPNETYKVKVNDILITRSNTPELVGDACLVKNTNCNLMYSDLIYKIKVNEYKIDLNFLNYYLISKDFRKQVIICAKGLNLSMVKVSQQSIKNWYLSIPDKVTGHKIANYLNVQTANIDQELSILEQKIEKYKELKQTIIARTVLQGLDKNVELKNSEVEWIGYIPNHWEVKRYKDAFPIISSGIKYFDDTKSYLSTKSVGMNKIIEIEDEITYENRPSRANMQPSKNTAWFAKMRFTDKCLIFTNYDLEKYILSTGFSGIKIKNDYIEFVKYYLMSSYFKYEKDIYSYGTTQESINDTYIAMLHYVKPPYDEQVAIANYLDEKTSKIDSIIESIGKKIEVLKEFRKTLINDVVTGKVKVA